MQSAILSLPRIMIKTSGALVDVLFFQMVIDKLIYDHAADDIKTAMHQLLQVRPSHIIALRQLESSSSVMHRQVIYSESLLLLTNTVYVSSPALRIIVEQISGQGFDWPSPAYPEQCSEKQDSQ